MNQKGRKIADILFSLLFLMMITIPFLCMNTEEYVESEIENRALTSWPGWGFNKEYNDWYLHYAEDRIGFRKEAIEFFTRANHSFFHEFSEELHMYGKEDYVFPADEGYIQSYQHLNTDENLVDSLAIYLENTNEYLQAKGIPFVFMICPDKKSVYGDYFPDYIHVNVEKPDTLELLKDKLDQAGVPYVIPVEEFRQAAKTSQIYNKKYDSAHWNDFGALYGLQLVSEKFRTLGSVAPVLSEDDYNLSFEEMKTMEFIDIPINEQVPYYTLKVKPALSTNQNLEGALKRVNGTSIQHYKNPDAKSDETILVFHDSFLQSNKKFFVNNYKEVYLVSRQNYEGIQYYVNVLQPDLVLYENAERAFADDLYAYTGLRNIQYQMPYETVAFYEGLNKAERKKESSRLESSQAENRQPENSQTEYSQKESSQAEKELSESGLSLSISNIEGAVLLENILYYDKKSGVVELQGELAGANPENYGIYVKYKDQYFEASYGGFAGEKNISASFRSNKMKKGTMEFIAISKETGEEISLQSFEVKKKTTE